MVRPRARAGFPGRRIAENARWEELRPGEYSLQSWEGYRYWITRDPSGGAGSLTGFRVAEHRDGTISVVGHFCNRNGSWCGYLKRGVWYRGKDRVMKVLPAAPAETVAEDDPEFS